MELKELTPPKLRTCYSTKNIIKLTDRQKTGKICLQLQKKKKKHLIPSVCQELFKITKRRQEMQFKIW